MKQLLMAVLVFGGISCGVEQVRTEETPASAPRSAETTSSAVDPDPGVVKPHFIQCDQDQICTTVQQCTLQGGTPGDPLCSSGLHCCTL